MIAMRLFVKEAEGVWPRGVYDWEDISAAGYDAFAADVWSFGMLLFTLSSGLKPFRAPCISDSRFASFVNKTQPHTLQDEVFASLPGAEGARASVRSWSWPDVVSPALQHLVTGCLRVRSEERFTMQQVLNHPWFSTPGWTPPPQGAGGVHSPQRGSPRPYKHPNTPSSHKLRLDGRAGSTEDSLREISGSASIRSDSRSIAASRMLSGMSGTRVQAAGPGSEASLGGPLPSLTSPGSTGGYFKPQGGLLSPAPSMQSTGSGAADSVMSGSAGHTAFPEAPPAAARGAGGVAVSGARRMLVAAGSSSTLSGVHSGGHQRYASRSTTTSSGGAAATDPPFSNSAQGGVSAGGVGFRPDAPVPAVGAPEGGSPPPPTVKRTTLPAMGSSPSVLAGASKGGGGAAMAAARTAVRSGQGGVQGGGAHS